MKTIQGPALFLAQFMGDEAPFDSLDNVTRWAGSLGYKGVQIPTWDSRCMDLERAANDPDYCDSLRKTCEKNGVEITELSTHLQGQLVAVHPAYDEMFDAFAPDDLKGRPAERQAWATRQLLLAAKASKNLDLKAHATFSGALMWHTVYPWPQRPAGLVEAGFAELGRRWLPILDAFDAAGVDVCYEIHPGEDLHDGATFEMFLDAVQGHSRANILFDPSHFLLQQLDYLDFIERYHGRIRMFHVKDAEFRPDGRTGVYGGYQDWQHRAGRFRSPGDGQVDFKGIFTLLTKHDFDGWAVVEWECCFKHPEDGAAEGARFVSDHLIRVTEKAFDDFAAGERDPDQIQRLLGIGNKLETNR